MAYAAIVSTLIFGSLFVGATGFFQTSDSGGFDSAAVDDIIGDGSNSGQSMDRDNDGLADVIEAQYGTDPDDEDTDKDGMSDGWEVDHGLNPLDGGNSEDEINDPGETNTDGGEIEEEDDSWPDPDDGPNGDPDRDGLINSVEMDEGTDPRRADTDGDGLNDKWEVRYKTVIQAGSGTNITMFDPLSGNWNCELLTDSLVNALEDIFDGSSGRTDLDNLRNQNGQLSCDMVLDTDQDLLHNFEEETYGTNPTLADSDGDMLNDVDEISNSTIMIGFATGQNCGNSLLDKVNRDAPFAQLALDNGLAWFLEDMDGDGALNGPSDYDTDGDGMPDGYEFCFSHINEHPLYGNGNAGEQLLGPANNSDGYGDWDEDGMNNIEEFQVSLAFGENKFTSPWHFDTDQDGMPDGWEATNGLDPRDGSNRDLDPDHDGYDADGDGAVTYSELEDFAVVAAIDVSIDDWVEANQTVARAQITLSGGNRQIVPLIAPVAGYVYSINVEIGDSIELRTDVWIEIVEIHEMFTNVMEYNARDTDGDGIIDGRSTDPLNPDTDGDGLKDGIEVIGWEILVVNRGVQTTHVTSDPGLWDTDEDGLSDFKEFSEVCDFGSNASNADTDGDGLGDQAEALNGFTWAGDEGLEEYFTSPCMYDTDNDGLEDGEEVILGLDNFLTHANDPDTDDDGLIDGYEVLFVPRPFQNPTNPLINDTDSDGMEDGWEMQVESVEDNTKSHSLWVATDLWLPPGCESMIECGLDAGGYMWKNWLGGFILEKKYEIHEMNLTNFLIPANDKCGGCYGRWAMDPSEGSLKDDTYDVDNDTLANSAEAPDRWNTNPVDDDTDGDLLPDGWEVKYSQQALENGLVDNATTAANGARGIMDPSMIDSDLDGIDDGMEDPDHDGLNRSGLIAKYCPSYDDPTSSNCHINPDTPDGKRFYDNLENYTSYEEFINGTNPISNDSDGDEWDDGPEVYYQDHDDDGMATGWEYYFNFDPFDAADRMVDTDGDGHVNYCEYKWDTNPRDINSFPGQGQLCNAFEE
ncbi:MAG: hypothetical protein QGI21_03345 [Candidatus Poseidoniaceae archaeon]|jgi:hypothetical protein|nr:hypothetical protein [Candidatus Poseidoniaceae archaeon]